MMQDLAVDQYSTWKDQGSTTHIGDTIVIIKTPLTCSLSQPTSSLYRDTSMNNPESHDTDSDSQDNYQEDVNDLEHIRLNPPVKLKHLTCKMEQLRQTVKDKDKNPMDAIKHLEQKLNQLAITLCPPTEPIGEVLNRYTSTLHNGQKKTSLESSLLQDIPILTGNDSSQLEDWLADIETASELTGESKTKLAQAESRGLVRTLISDALTLNKTWEDIRDSLCLKICN